MASSRGLIFASFLAPRLEALYEQTTAAIGAALAAEARLVRGESFDDLVAGRLDGAFLCGLPYVDLRDRAGAAIEPLAAPVPVGARYDERPVYFSDVIVRADSAARAFEDLRGLRFGYNEPASHSGHNAMAGELVRRGLGDGFFGSSQRTGDHVESLRQVEGGAIDVAAIDSHLLDALRSHEPSLVASIRSVAAIGPAPSQPLVAGPALSQEHRDVARDAAIAMRATALGRAALRAGHVERWQAVSDAEYDEIRAVRGLLG